MYDMANQNNRNRIISLRVNQTETDEIGMIIQKNPKFMTESVAVRAAISFYAEHLIRTSPKKPIERSLEFENPNRPVAI